MRVAAVVNDELTVDGHPPCRLGVCFRHGEGIGGSQDFGIENSDIRVESRTYEASALYIEVFSYTDGHFVDGFCESQRLALEHVVGQVMHMPVEEERVLCFARERTGFGAGLGINA